MKPATSLYLDLVRFAAAMAVFVGHLAAARDPLFLPPALGQALAGVSLCIDEAVIVFFVLSGYVIAHATEGRHGDARAYAIARLSRVYSVALPALAVTLVLDLFGSALRPDLYQPLALLPFLGAALFLNQLWYVDVGAGSNAPYWSLNYEAWYYLLFALLIFARGWRRTLGVAAVLLLCGPQIALYFLLWLFGVWLHRHRRDALPRPLAWAMALGGPVVLGFTIACGLPWEDWVLARLAWVIRDSNISHDAVVALAFGLHLWGLNALAGAVPGWLAPLERPIRWLAGATFTIYLFHMPLSRFLLALLPAEPGPWSAPVLLGGGFLLLLGIAQLTERRKAAWQRLFEALLPRRARIAA